MRAVYQAADLIDAHLVRLAPVEALQAAHDDGEAEGCLVCLA